MKTNLEYYKDEFKRLIIKNRNVFIGRNIGDAFDEFASKHCEKFYYNPSKFIDWLFEENKESELSNKIKLTKFELDLILACGEYNSDYSKYDYVIDYIIIEDMFDKGHFKGLKNLSMSFDTLLNNYEIVPEDYNFEGDENENN